jgi:hypothetical protein
VGRKSGDFQYGDFAANKSAAVGKSGAKSWNLKYRQRQLQKDGPRSTSERPWGPLGLRRLAPVTPVFSSLGRAINIAYSNQAIFLALSDTYSRETTRDLRISRTAMVDILDNEKGEPAENARAPRRESSRWPFFRPRARSTFRVMINVTRPDEFSIPIRLIGIVEFTASSATENLAHFLQRLVSSPAEEEDSGRAVRWNIRAIRSPRQAHRFCLRGTIRVTANLENLDADLCEAHSAIAHSLAAKS